MNNDDVRRTIERARTEVARTQILIFSRTNYPGWLNNRVLSDSMKECSSGVSNKELEVLAHYLADKKLLVFEEIHMEGEYEGWKIKLTPRGIDFLDGLVEEIGLASPDTLDRNA